HAAEHLQQFALRHGSEIAFEQLLGRALRFAHCRLAMDQPRHPTGQRALRLPTLGFPSRCSLELRDLYFIEEGEELQITARGALTDVQPELMKLVRLGQGGIEPDRADLGLAELRT